MVKPGWKLVSLCLTAAVCAAGGQAGQWQESIPLNPRGVGSEVIWAPHGEFLVPGGDSGFFASADGLVWRRHPWPGQTGVRRLATDGVRIVAAGWTLIAVSHDGLQWDTAPLPEGLQPRRVVWAEDRFLAIGGDSSIWTSSDGLNWSREWSGGGGLFAAAGGGARKVAVGLEGRIIVSVDGGAWGNADSGTADHLNDVTWTGELFVAVGTNGTILTSSDGVVWNQAPGGAGAVLRTVHWTGSLVLAGGSCMLVSQDGGRTWTEQVSPWREGFDLFGLASGGPNLLGMGYFAEPVVSLDGFSWVDYRVAPRALAASGDTVVAVGLRGGVLASRDGREFAWTGRVATADLFGVAWTGREFVAVGDSGTVLRSPDGWHWVEAGSGLTEDLRQLVWDGARLVATTSAGGIAVAVGGDDWQLSLPPSGVRAVATNGRQAVAVGDGGLVLVSGYGGDFVAVESGTNRDLLDVVWGREEFLAIGRSGTILASADGHDWTSRRTWFRTDRDPWVPSGSGLALTSVDFSHAGYWVHADPYHQPEGGDDTTAQPENGLPVELSFFSRDGVVWMALSGPAHKTVGFKGREVTHVGDTTAGVLRSRERGVEALVVPVAAHLPGINDTFWQTDLDLFNPGGTTAEVLLEFLPREGTPAAATQAVDPGRALRLRDVVNEVFESSGAGALRLTPLVGRIGAGSRTYTSTEAGTLGQGVRALPAGDALRPGRDGRLVGLVQAPDRVSGFRTNLGLVNLTPLAVEVVVLFSDQGGAQLGAVTEVLPAHRPLQINEILLIVAPAGVEHATATISVVTPGGAVVAYATVVDNRSGDTVFMVAR